MLGWDPFQTYLICGSFFHSALMYSHRSDQSRVDVVDLDPYGSATPFIDASVQSVNDGGVQLMTYRNVCLTLA
jgi:N2,N2-dimethylguanosine tRNA methyltransferase